MLSESNIPQNNPRGRKSDDRTLLGEQLSFCHFSQVETRVRVRSPPLLSSRNQPPAPPLMHRLHQYLEHLCAHCRTSPQHIRELHFARWWQADAQERQWHVFNASEVGEITENGDAPGSLAFRDFLGVDLAFQCNFHPGWNKGGGEVQPFVSVHPHHGVSLGGLGARFDRFRRSFVRRCWRIRRGLAAGEHARRRKAPRSEKFIHSAARIWCRRPEITSGEREERQGKTFHLQSIAWKCFTHVWFYPAWLGPEGEQHRCWTEPQPRGGAVVRYHDRGRGWVQ